MRVMPSQDPDRDQLGTNGTQLGTFRRERGTYLDHAVVEAIDELLRRGGTWTAAQILKELQKNPSLPTLPVAKTIRRYIARRTPANSGSWTLADADGEDAALILPVLAVVLRKLDGRVRQLTLEEADWIVRLRRADPGMPCWATYVLARMYLSNMAADLPTEFIDRIIAGAPWRDPDDYLVARAGIPQVSLSLLGDLTDRTYEGHHDG